MEVVRLLMLQLNVDSNEILSTISILHAQKKISSIDIEKIKFE